MADNLGATVQLTNTGTKAGTPTVPGQRLGPRDARSWVSVM
jgi:hypothetical protein